MLIAKDRRQVDHLLQTEYQSPSRCRVSRFRPASLDISCLWEKRLEQRGLVVRGTGLMRHGCRDIAALQGQNLGEEVWKLFSQAYTMYYVGNRAKVKPCITWEPRVVKRDIQGKFTLKNDDYRQGKHT